MGPDFTLNIEQTDRYVLVIPEGELDLAVRDAFHARVSEVIASGATTVVVDLSRLSFIDSAGLTGLVAAHREAGRRGARLSLISPSNVVRRLLELTAIAEIIPVLGSLDEAVGGVDPALHE